MKRDVSVQPQVEAQIPKTHCWKLLVAVYGLSDAALEWYQTLMNQLYTQKIYECLTHHCLFYLKTDNGHCICLLIVHVDEILFGGTTESENRVQRALGGLKLGTIKRQNFDFLGLSVETYNDHIDVKHVLRDVM